MMKRIGSILLVSSLILSACGSCVSASDNVKETVSEVSEVSEASEASEAKEHVSDETAEAVSLADEAQDQSAEQNTEQNTEQDPEENADQNTDQGAEQDPDEECEWNVLLYLCGTDLESGQGAATKNLKGIASALPQEGVNFLIETGGASAWDPNDELGFEIANDKLQRWSYGEDGFVLVDEVDEACMSDGRTLTDFIRWAGENYSAKKNLLILWDHGGGSSKGLICDENYGFTIMPVYMLEEALRDAGTHFDLLLTDTCLMASLEMCQALAPYVDYLAASEEVMAGDGTNYGSWVQYLYDRPECTPVQLGKRMCDATQQYYVGKEGSEEYKSFTMSLIDLSQTDAVAEAFNAFMHEAADLVKDPEAFYEYAYQTHYAENYYLDTMYDLFDLSRRAENAGISKEITHALQDAVENAVVYNLRSDYHMYSYGMSVYYPMKNDGYDLDHFARTCKNAEHLAFLDSINLTWDAPSWVYEETERHPELDRSAYLAVPNVDYTDDGSGVYMTLDTGEDAAVFLSYALYHQDEDTGVMYTLGESGYLIPELDEETGKYRFKPGFDGTWPTMGGKPLCMSIADETEKYILYNVPIGLWNDTYQMRVMVNYEKYGIDNTWGDDTEEDTEDSTESEDESVQEDESANVDESAEDESAEDESAEDESAEDESAEDESAEDESAEDESAENESAEDESAEDDEDANPYELLGIWDGFDAHTGLPGRNIIPLSEVDGEDVTLYDVLYSISLDKIVDYIDKMNTTLTKDSVIEEQALPKGEYLIRFVVRDVFNTAHYSDTVPVSWDGETISYDYDD